MARRNSDATSFTLRLRKKARRSRAVLCRSKSGGRCACTRAQMFKSSSRITIPILNHIGILDVQPLNLTPMRVAPTTLPAVGETLVVALFLQLSGASLSSPGGGLRRLPLLPTPPRSDAVTVGYRPEQVYLKRTCTSLDRTRSRAHGRRDRPGDDDSGM